MLASEAAQKLPDDGGMNEGQDNRSQNGITFVAGVEGGATSTVAVVAAVDSSTGEVLEFLGSASSGPSNPWLLKGGVAEVATIIGGLFSQITRGRHILDVVVMALSGFGRSDDAEELESIFQRNKIVKVCSVLPDAVGGLFAVKAWMQQSQNAERMACFAPQRLNDRFDRKGYCADAETAVLICGTGSVAFSYRGETCVGRAGGRGHLLGDFGSAFWIGREALSFVLLQEDGISSFSPSDVSRSADSIEWLRIKW